MFAYKNYMKLFSLFLVAFASSTAAAAHNNDEQQQQQQLIGGGSFQLHGLHGEGHQCQDLSQLSSAVVSLIKMVDQHEQQQQQGEVEEEGHHRVLGTCDGVSQGCTANWCCFVCGWNCRRTRTRTLRGSSAVDEIDSTNFLLPASAASSIIEAEAPTTNNEKVNAGEVITVNLHNNGSTDNYPSSPECDGVSQGCTAWWCCTVCGWNCRRNLVEETNNALTWLEDGDDTLELPGCLAGANLKLLSPPVDGETDVVVNEESTSSSNP